MIARLPIRLRLTLAFVVAMALVFGALGTFLYLRLGAELDRALEDRLRAESAEVGRVAREDVDDLDAPRESPLTDVGKPYAQILTPAGRVLDATPRWRDRRVLDPARAAEPARSGEATFDTTDGESRLRVRAARVSAAGRPLLTLVGVSVEERAAALDGLAALLLVGGPVALLLASAAGYAVAAGALRPVEAMRRGAAGLVEPGGRLPVPPARDELARLGGTLNDMLGRQEAAFARERAFVADASHELRTPLAILKAELELALRDGRSVEELLTALGSAAEETDRLVRLAEDLLVIARADQGRLPVRTQEVAASRLLGVQRRRFAGRFAERGRSLTLELGEETVLAVDPYRLEQALGNMLENALQHGEGDVVLAARRSGGEAHLSVADSGPGFPADFLPSAFERFARAEAGRSSAGAGLGLAIVAAIARAHDGRAGARNRAEGGAEVWLTVPVATRAPAPEPRESVSGAR